MQTDQRGWIQTEISVDGWMDGYRLIGREQVATVATDFQYVPFVFRHFF
jgi:hypothetical protein